MVPKTLIAIRECSTLTISPCRCLHSYSANFEVECDIIESWIANASSILMVLVDATIVNNRWCTYSPPLCQLGKRKPNATTCGIEFDKNKKPEVDRQHQHHAYNKCTQNK